MKIRVLGSAAGGGFPQWNCNHPNSRRARQRSPGATPRTQSSIAVSGDGERWVLCNASPDLRQQMFDNAVLHPRQGLRDSPLQAVVLTNADVDHVAGLLTLRESQPLRLYASSRVLSVLGQNPVFDVLNPDFVARVPLELDVATPLSAPDGTPLGIELVPFAVPGKVALWLEKSGAGPGEMLNKSIHGPGFGSVAEDTIALELRDTGGADSLFYVPGCAAMTPALAERLRGAALVLFDGTLWRDDEMIRDRVGVKTGQRMGHMSVTGEEGTLAAFAGLGVRRKVFIHINTTNPLLLDDSAERAAVVEQGWQVAFDGMELEL